MLKVKTLVHLDRIFLFWDQIHTLPCFQFLLKLSQKRLDSCPISLPAHPRALHLNSKQIQCTLLPSEYTHTPSSNVRWYQILKYFTCSKHFFSNLWFLIESEKNDYVKLMIRWLHHPREVCFHNSIILRYRKSDSMINISNRASSPNLVFLNCCMHDFFFDWMRNTRLTQTIWTSKSCRAQSSTNK